jgi:hypothetical protein
MGGITKGTPTGANLLLGFFSNGEITQEIKIHYNCIGAFTVPDREHIPELEILLEVRKGVVYNYTGEKQAG